jgi:hypothetical protein
MKRPQAQGFGIALVVLGLVLLLGRGLSPDLARIGWPLFILGPGALLVAAGLYGPRDWSGLVAPGSVIAAVGAILMWQSVTGRFESWAYLWALIPTAAGIGVFLQGNRADNDELRENGRRTATAGLLMLLAFGAFFELFIFGGFAGAGIVGRIVLPLAAVAVGVWLLYRRDEGEPAAPRQPES